MAEIFKFDPAAINRKLDAEIVERERIAEEARRAKEIEIELEYERRLWLTEYHEDRHDDDDWY